MITFKPRSSLDNVISRQVAFLSVYQNAAYAEQYRTFVARVKEAEQEIGHRLRLDDMASRSAHLKHQQLISAFDDHLPSEVTHAVAA
ncbi:MAG: hypothetical protein H7240_12065 [Glaciimonas sp.]|nr:hypothetical protein [Glaciimonas sp.]